jgi:hypothetical protein
MSPSGSGPNLTANLTVNTDFAETEVDQRQANLTRFDILFPEKRSFFLEGADIFEFGLGTDLEDATVQPFYSRPHRALHARRRGRGHRDPILAGGKIQGRIGSPTWVAWSWARMRTMTPACRRPRWASSA